MCSWKRKINDNNSICFVQFEAQPSRIPVPVLRPAAVPPQGHNFPLTFVSFDVMVSRKEDVLKLNIAMCYKGNFICCSVELYSDKRRH
jgi:hypothetical protein